MKITNLALKLICLTNYTFCIKNVYFSSKLVFNNKLKFVLYK